MGHSDMIEYLIPIIGERLPSVLREDDLKGRGLLMDTFISRMLDIGLDYTTTNNTQERLHNLMTMLKTGGFTIESSSTSECRVDVIRLLKFCKDYLKRRVSLPITSYVPRMSLPSEHAHTGPISEILTRNEIPWSNKKPIQKMISSNQLEDHIKVVNGCMISSEIEDPLQRKHHHRHIKDNDYAGETIIALLHQQQLELDLMNRNKQNKQQQSPIKLNQPWMKARDHKSPEKRHSILDGSHSSVAYDITIPDPVSPSKLTDLVGVKVPEKRHVPSPLRLPKSVATVTTSNVFHRLKRTLPTLLDVEIKKFYHSLCKSAVASGSFLTKSAIPSCLLDIGVKISHYDGELLWEDLTYGGRRLSITPEQCLEQLGMTVSETTKATVESSLESLRKKDRAMKIMQSSPLRQSIGYDENDIAMLRLVQQDDEMRLDIDSKLSSREKAETYTSPEREVKHVWTGTTAPETNHDSPPPSPPVATVNSPTTISLSEAAPLSVASSAPSQAKIQDAISILAGKKIDLALLYRRWGGSVLGCRGNVLLDMLLSPPLSLDLTRDEASILICEAGMKFYHHMYTSHISTNSKQIVNCFLSHGSITGDVSVVIDPSRFEISYAQLVSYIDRRKDEYGVVSESESRLVESIKRKLVSSKEIRGKRDNLISLGHSLRVRLRSMQGRYTPNNGMSRGNYNIISRAVDNEDINSAEIQGLFRWIDVNFTTEEVHYLKKCLSDEPEQWKDRRHAEEGRIGFSKLIMFLVESFMS